jgi:hypothetical protein
MHAFDICASNRGLLPNTSKVSFSNHEKMSLSVPSNSLSSMPLGHFEDSKLRVLVGKPGMLHARDGETRDILGRIGRAQIPQEDFSKLLE